jgi:hypothetical protein
MMPSEESRVSSMSNEWMLSSSGFCQVIRFAWPFTHCVPVCGCVMLKTMCGGRRSRDDETRAAGRARTLDVGVRGQREREQESEHALRERGEEAHGGLLNADVQVCSRRGEDRLREREEAARRGAGACRDGLPPPRPICRREKSKTER